MPTNVDDIGANIVVRTLVNTRFDKKLDRFIYCFEHFSTSNKRASFLNRQIYIMIISNSLGAKMKIINFVCSRPLGDVLKIKLPK